MQTTHSSPLRWLVALLLTLSLFPAFAAKPLDETESLDADAQTAALVVRRLARDDLEAYHRIDVKVVDGRAVLTGTARTRQGLDAIVREVGKVPGVRSVEEHVKVEPTP
ncbi:BON domain-containing protein [Tahibacter soli]|uniref:BON domain-containing protein n=1 Tax=Tahibacter soli TaxID=2983605 RepID=A0A9X3YHN6_9GAMM|nr:BON domain-containing protein [Tahibacter soli]MDC8010968.1 BON domain-containing protein [Tahibacter soli]